jgi:hypothetical protein
MLVIDEAHYLWPQYQRSYSSPELIDWVNTALVNHDVPVALICTDQFAKLKARVEKQTGWTSEQLEHRVKRYKKLSRTPKKKTWKLSQQDYSHCNGTLRSNDGTFLAQRRILTLSKSLWVTRSHAKRGCRRSPTLLKKLVIKLEGMGVHALWRRIFATRFSNIRFRPIRLFNARSTLHSVVCQNL